jgi:hypothetical protein
MLLETRPFTFNSPPLFNAFPTLASSSLTLPPSASAPPVGGCTCTHDDFATPDACLAFLVAVGTPLCTHDHDDFVCPMVDHVCPVYSHDDFPCPMVDHVCPTYQHSDFASADLCRQTCQHVPADFPVSPPPDLSPDQLMSMIQRSDDERLKFFAYIAKEYSGIDPKFWPYVHECYINPAEDAPPPKGARVFRGKWVIDEERVTYHHPKDGAFNLGRIPPRYSAVTLNIK